MSAPLLYVAVAIIADAAGRVLITRRAAATHQDGLWEFPGSKISAGESSEQALARALYEDLGIVVRQIRPLRKVRHTDAEYSVRLHVFRVQAYDGEPYPRAGQSIRWIAPEDLPALTFPAANRPIINAMRLPAYYLITGDFHVSAQADFFQRLKQSLRDGIKLVQLRVYGLDAGEYCSLAQQVIELCHTHDAKLLLNSDPQQAAELGAHGVHLNSARLLSLQARPLDNAFWVAASCHNADELEHAEAIGVDFAVLSPIVPTLSHPGRPALGWTTFQALTERVNLPIYALGGLRPEDLMQAHSHGAHGIAAVRAWWNAAC